MTSFSQRITSADSDSYLKRDPIYQEVQKKYHSHQQQLQTRHSWVRALDTWTGSSNTLTKIAGFVALFFAKIHDAYYRKEIQEIATKLDKIEWRILSETAIRQEQRILLDYERDSPENHKQFTWEGLPLHHILDDQWIRFRAQPKEATIALTMMHQGGYVDHMHTAIQWIKKEYGIDVDLAQSNTGNSKVRSMDGITFTRQFEIRLRSQPDPPIGILTIDGNYLFSSESGQVNYACHWNAEKTLPSVEPGQATPPFIQTHDDYEIDTATFEKYDLETFPERGIRQCTKDFIKSAYGLDCDLLLEDRDDNDALEQPGRFYPTCKYALVHKGKNIGTITARGELLLTLKSGHIDFRATFESEDQLRNLQEAQQKELEERFEKEAGFNPFEK